MNDETGGGKKIPSLSLGTIKPSSTSENSNGGGSNSAKPKMGGLGLGLDLSKA